MLEGSIKGKTKIDLGVIEHIIKVTHTWHYL
jgi:hypothetical protein